MNRRRLASLMAASALLIGMFGLSAGGSIVLATGANTQFWAGNGTENGEIKNNDCATDSSAHQLWIWTGTGTNVQISVAGEVKDGVQQGNGAYHFTTGWHDIGTLTTGQGGNVFVTYDGAVDGNAVVTLSHGCPGDTSTTTTTESSSTTTTTDSSSTTTTTESSSTTTTTDSSSTTTTTTATFTGGSEPATDAPTQPNTAVTSGGPSTPSNSAWLLILALGLLLGSVVILTPAKAKTKS